MSAWKLLKTVAAVTDETDWAGTLAEPTAADTAKVPQRRSDGAGDVTGIEVMVEWLASTTRVAGRGTFDLQFTGIAKGLTAAGAPSGLPKLVWSAETIAGVGYQPIIIDFAGGFAASYEINFTTRMFNIAAPATTDGFRVWWRER